MTTVTKLAPDPVAYGSAERPVSQDPYEYIVAVHWDDELCDPSTGGAVGLWTCSVGAHGLGPPFAILAFHSFAAFGNGVGTGGAGSVTVGFCGPASVNISLSDAPIFMNFGKLDFTLRAILDSGTIGTNSATDNEGTGAYSGQSLGVTGTGAVGPGEHAVTFELTADGDGSGGILAGDAGDVSIIITAI